MKSLWFLILIFTLFNSYGAERGLSSVVKHLDASQPVGSQYLMVIAIDNYRHWSPLKNPVQDAREIRDILKSRYFIDHVIELYDQQATKKNIMSQFKQLKEVLTIRDSLVIFFAGHGFSPEESSQGYWMAVDAGNDKIEKKNWISNNEITDSLAALESSHICLLVDSCFSGSLLNTQRSGAALPDPSDIPYFRKAYRLTSRQVITSGASEESVPDVSEFAGQLKMALKKNTATFLNPLTLYNGLRLGVSQTQAL